MGQTQFIGIRAASEASQGGHAKAGHGPTFGRAQAWHGPLVAPLRSPFGPRLRVGEILMYRFVLSNSENIFLIDFLK